EVAVFTGCGVEAFVWLQISYAGDDNGAVFTGVERDPAGWLNDRATHDLHTGSLVCWQILQGVSIVQRSSSVDQRGTATGNNAFFKCGTSRGHSIFDAALALFELNLGCSTDLDDGDATGQFGQAFLQFFTVPVRVGCFDLGTDLGNTIGDVLCFTGAIHDGGGFLGDGDATCSTQHFQTH